MGKRLLALGILGAIAAVLWHQRPDIERYLRIKQM
jgi:hypothetical protein